MTKIRPLTIATLFCVTSAGFAQTTVSGSYSQDFNTLASTGTANSWVQDSTISEWWAFRFPNSTQVWVDVTQYAANDGTTATGTLYSYGSTASSERALGSVGSGNDASGGYRYGTGFTNGFLNAITDLDISYRGETWRVGTTTNTNNVEFQYSKNAAGVNDNTGTWIDFDPLDYKEANNSVAGALDGNVWFLQKQGSITGLDIAPGSTIWMRWWDIDHVGADYGLAIDDLSIRFGTATVPEPASLAMIASGLVALRLRRSRKNKTPTLRQTR